MGLLIKILLIIFNDILCNLLLVVLKYFEIMVLLYLYLFTICDFLCLLLFYLHLYLLRLVNNIGKSCFLKFGLFGVFKRIYFMAWLFSVSLKIFGFTRFTNSWHNNDKIDLQKFIIGNITKLIAPKLKGIMIIQKRSNYRFRMHSKWLHLSICIRMFWI